MSWGGDQKVKEGHNTDIPVTGEVSVYMMVVAQLGGGRCAVFFNGGRKRGGSTCHVARSG